MDRGTIVDILDTKLRVSLTYARNIGAVCEIIKHNWQALLVDDKIRGTVGLNPSFAFKNVLSLKQRLLWEKIKKS